MRWVVVALVVAQTGCGRLGFDALFDGDARRVDATPVPGRWMTLIGRHEVQPPEHTWNSHVVERPDGTIWIFGSSFALGPNYIDPWFGTLDGQSGELVDGGVRGFAGGSETVENVLSLADGFLLVGATYFGPDSQQPAFGELALDGTWRSTARMAGGLLHPGEFEQFTDARSPSDGGLVLVGYTRQGQGGCAACKGIDALIVRLDAKGAVVNVATYGLSFGDESLFRVVTLPGGDHVAFGGGYGSYDYSGGAETDVDNAPSFAMRFTDIGALVWTRQLRFPSERGGGVRAAVYDAGSDEIVIGGSMAFRTVPFFAHLLPATGVSTRVRAVSLDGNRGGVTDIALAPDGGLFVAGYELIPPEDVSRNMYVARLAPDRETVEWAIRAPLGYTESGIDITLAADGDVIVAASGAGTMGVDTLIARIGADGTTPECWNATPATLTLTAVTDMSVNPGYVQASPAGVVEALISSSTSLPGTLADLSATCSP